MTMSVSFRCICVARVGDGTASAEPERNKPSIVPREVISGPYLEPERYAVGTDHHPRHVSDCWSYSVP